MSGRRGRGSVRGRGRGVASSPTESTSAPSLSSTSAHFQLLKKTTEVKLRELTKHERKLEDHYTQLLKDTGVADAVMAELSALATGAHTDELTAQQLRSQLDALYEGVKDLHVVQTSVHTGLQGVDGLVEFAACDPWTTKRVLQQRAEHILREVQQKRALWRHNKLLGALLMESLDETEREQKTNVTMASKQQHESVVTVDDPSDFVTVDDAGPLMGLTKEETQTRLESFFFESNGVREDDVVAFLETLVFAPRESVTKEKTKRMQDALATAKASLHMFSKSFLEETVTESDVLATVNAMLRDKASFSDDIVTFLADVKGNNAMQEELADVLTIQLSNLKEFTWPTEGVDVEIKRSINGRFRCFLQEDALTALLFQFVGLSWSVQMKKVLTALLDSLHDEATYRYQSLDAFRRSLIDRFRLSALPASLETAGGGYDEAADNADNKISKQDIVRLVFAEAHLVHALEVGNNDEANKVAKSLVALTTDLEFFGPSVSHEAAFACLRVLGVSDDMLGIFRNYVHIPLVFPGYAAPKLMVRGLSVGRMMTMFLSELLLFVVDYQVLATTGVSLFRMHDDIWLFDADVNKVVRAWEEMNKVVKTIGLRFNEEKTGSLRISVGSDLTSATLLPSSLPAKPIKWGLLVLQSDGTVKIANEQVVAFTTEMADRLQAAASVLSWVNVYNKYMGFFLRNLGSASPVFGLAYVDAILDTLKNIHELIFSQTDGDVLACLNAKIAANHPTLVVDKDAASLPAAWVHWSMQLGGLGLFNPFLAIWSLKQPMYAHLQAHHSPTGKIWPKEKKHWQWQQPFSTMFLKNVKEPYDLFAESIARNGIEWAESAKPVFQYVYLKSSTVSDARRWHDREKIELDTSFSMRTFEEYLAVVTSVPNEELVAEFTALVGEVTAEDPVNVKSPTQKAATKLLDAAAVKGPYWKWVAYIYGEQLMAEFGTVAFFSRELLPAQLVQTIKSTAVSW